jgi:hypothetical protein
LGAGRDCAAGCCGACVDYGCTSPGLEGSGEVDGFCADYWVGGYCHVASGLNFISLTFLDGKICLLTAGWVMVMELLTVVVLTTHDVV